MSRNRPYMEPYYINNSIELSANVPQIIYSADGGLEWSADPLSPPNKYRLYFYASLTLAICNTDEVNPIEVDVYFWKENIPFTAVEANTSRSNAIEYKLSIPPKATFERRGLLVPTGCLLTVLSNQNGTLASVYGVGGIHQYSLEPESIS